MDRLQGHIPSWAGRNFGRLRRPARGKVRVPAGIALTGGSLFGFLPVLGVWMLPVGLALLAHDVPPMRRPLARMLHFTKRKIEQRKGQRMGKKSELAAGRRPTR